MDELLKMPEYKLRQELLGFETSLYIFDVNYTEFKNIVEVLLKDRIKYELVSPRNQDQLRLVQMDILRRLHNFVAAAKSLVDHSRNLNNKLYKKQNSFPEYQERVKLDFAEDPLSQFVQDLREYCQHYRAPSIGLSVSVQPTANGDIEEWTVFLAQKDLRQFDGWNAKAKQYLNEHKGDINILETIDKYRNKVVDFYKWFLRRQDEIHAEEISRFEAKQSQAGILFFEWKINACLKNKGSMPFRGEEIYNGILTREEFEILEKLPKESPARLSLAIEFVEKRFKLPTALKKKLSQLYKEEEFFSKRQKG